MSEIRIGVIDDHPMFREGVMYTLRQQPDFLVVGSGGCADDAVAIASTASPDVMLLDLSMPGGGLAALEMIGAVVPSVHCMVLTFMADTDLVCRAMRAGSRGYILKGEDGADLVRAVRMVSRGEAYVSPSLAAGVFGSIDPGAAAKQPAPGLSTREEQILVGLQKGLSNKEIAAELAIREKTVKHYVTAVLQKLQVRNRVQAALVGKGSARGAQQDRLANGPGIHH